MSHDGQGAEKAKCGRKIPTLAEEKEITPKTPGGELRSDEERVLGVKMQTVTEQSGKCGIRREKGDVGHLHHLVIDGWNDRLVAAVDDVHEPIAIVLNQGGIAKRERAFRGE